MDSMNTVSNYEIGKKRDRKRKDKTRKDAYKIKGRREEKIDTKISAVKSVDKIIKKK